MDTLRSPVLMERERSQPSVKVSKDGRSATECKRSLLQCTCEITETLGRLYQSLLHPDTMTFQEYALSDAVQIAKVSGSSSSYR